MGSVGDSFLMDSRLNMPVDFDIDLGGSTIKCTLSSLNLFEVSEISKTVYSVTTQTALSNTVVLSAPPVGLSIGGEVSFAATDINDRWPPSLRRVKNIVGATITLDSQLDFAYSGTITMLKRTFRGRAIFKNGIIDGAGTTSAANQVSFLKDYETEIWDNITFKNFDLGTSGSKDLVVSWYAKNFTMNNCSFDNNIIPGQYCSAFFVSQGEMTDCKAITG